MSRWMSLVVFSAIAFVYLPAFTQEKKDEHAGHGGERDAMMKMWKEVSTTGEAQQKLSTLVGKWNTESSMWMDPQNPMVSKGSAEIRWILGGRFLQQDMTGEMMGMPFTGTGVTGY